MDEAISCQPTHDGLYTASAIQILDMMRAVRRHAADMRYLFTKFIEQLDVEVEARGPVDGWQMERGIGNTNGSGNAYSSSSLYTRQP